MRNQVSFLEMVTDLPGLKYPYPGGSSSLNFHKLLLGIQEQWVESNKQFGAASVVKTGIHIYVSIIYSSEAMILTVTNAILTIA